MLQLQDRADEALAACTAARDMMARVVAAAGEHVPLAERQELHEILASLQDKVAHFHDAPAEEADDGPEAAGGGVVVDDDPELEAPEEAPTKRPLSPDAPDPNSASPKKRATE